MKTFSYPRLLLLAAFIAIGPAVLAQRVVPPGAAKKAMEEKYGFRDLHFEQDTSSIPGLKRLFTHDNEVMYERPGETLTIGDAKVESITYGFFNGKLASVMVLTKGRENSKKVLATYQETYGTGWQPNRYMEQFVWQSNRVDMRVGIDAAGDGRVMIVSRPLEKQKTAYQKTAAKKAASDI